MYNKCVLKFAYVLDMLIIYRHYRRGVVVADFFDGWYDETPIENQNWQCKYNLRKEFIDLLFTKELSPEQRRRLDILHHGTEEEIKKLAETI